ncbi:HU domain-containing protein [Pontibacter cellulosilyticus]|uniref:HU-CCDC81 and SPOR domain-containing protein n=1 Tax=Pontibacter cellulosilyticus TaxID=1720253 RepID=A0A923SHJ9_9BACT|nr:SPOR domain-containing protein [Pontibacter cellulosilyticus]MBC5991824.1 HU-CCDC81 and SPOR domain-containing protein [Pontibacter cellulosilyticus]
MVEKHIKSLLYDHDCVIIPDFGGLITRYVSARINPVKHSFLPPSKKVAFNEKLVLNDGLLISTIAFRDQISKEEALQLVSDFVRRAKAALHQENKFILQDVGVFKYNTERRLEFEYVESDNMLEASFGLPELTARPIRFEEPAVLRTLKKDRQPEEEQTKQPFKKRLKRAYNIAAGLALFGLTASALYFLSLQADYNLSSLNPISLFNQSFNSVKAEAADKYAADYVPFTEEERLATYNAILPGAAQPEIIAEEEAQEQEEIAFDESNTSDEAMEEVVSESVEVAKPVEEVKKAAAPVLTINEKTDRFYIITGGYSTHLNAENSRYEINKKGFGEAKVLVPGRGSKLYRVSVADFGTEEEARAALDKYRSTFGETIWVFNY